MIIWKKIEFVFYVVFKDEGKGIEDFKVKMKF